MPMPYPDDPPRIRGNTTRRFRGLLVAAALTLTAIASTPSPARAEVAFAGEDLVVAAAAPLLADVPAIVDAVKLPGDVVAAPPVEEGGGGLPHKIISAILSAILPALFAGIAWLGMRLEAYIRARTKNDYAEGVLVRFQHLLFAVVKELSQTVVDQYKKASEDGKLTSEEKATIKRTAVATLKSYLGATGLAELGKVLGMDGGALDDYLGTAVEAAVLDLSRATPRAIVAAAPLKVAAAGVGG